MIGATSERGDLRRISGERGVCVDVIKVNLSCRSIEFLLYLDDCHVQPGPAVAAGLDAVIKKVLDEPDGDEVVVVLHPGPSPDFSPVS